MTIYHCQRNNQSIRLTEELAHSGEAKVWRTDFKGYLAKIYHDPHNERIQKLQVMVRHIPTDPNAQQNHISFAWPYSILADHHGDIVGFLMPEVVGSETLLKLCTPQLRRKLKLETNWYFLHVVARNVAGIIQAIHREGYVLGDIKLENILVNNRALPTIIDTDSFQVSDPYGNKIYRCLVGSEGFTPAELMGVDIASVDQTEVHDRFRLGVVIYYLLFGSPPFRGIWQGSGDAPEQSELIRRGLWPFSLDSLILPSPTTMPLKILHPRLQALFLRCFNDGHQFPHKRPTAGDWLEALEASFNELVSCGKVDSHFYSLSYGHCYWCDRAKALNFDLFPGNAVTARRPKPVPVPPPKPPLPLGVGKKSSLPKIVVSSPQPIIKKWQQRKILLRLVLVVIIIFLSVNNSQIFSPAYVKQKVTPALHNLAKKVEKGLYAAKGYTQLVKARKTAKLGTLSALNQAISEAQLVPHDNPHYADATQDIAKWTKQVQISEDNRVLSQAQKLASSRNIKDIQKAIDQVSQISSDRELYAKARQNIREWQAIIIAQNNQLALKQKNNTQITRQHYEQIILDNAISLGNAKNYLAAISAAQKINKSQALSGEARKYIARWQMEVNAQHYLQQAEDLAANRTVESLAQAIRIIRQVPRSTEAGLERAQFINHWSYQILSLAQEQASMANYNQAIHIARQIPVDSSFYDSTQELVQEWSSLIQTSSSQGQQPPIVETAPTLSEPELPPLRLDPANESSLYVEPELPPLRLD